MTTLTKLVDGRRVALASHEEDEVRARWDAAAAERDALTAREEALAYRRAREAAYAAGEESGGLGREPDKLRTIGDCLDVLVAQVEAMRAELGAARTAEFQDMLARIAAIKAAHPKPED